MCALCNLERLHIALAGKKTLNKRNKLISQCPLHFNEYLQIITDIGISFAKLLYNLCIIVI